MRLQSIRDAYSRHGDPNKAARVERKLAAVECREPEAWARNLPEQEPQAAPEARPPFEPKNDATTRRLRELAAKFRADQAAKRQAAE